MSVVLIKNFLHFLDNASHFFLLLVRHGDHVVFTQMVGTHDAMVKGTLDIPNLIKFKDIAQNFRLDIEVYGMVRNDFPAFCLAFYRTWCWCEQPLFIQSR